MKKTYLIYTAIGILFFSLFSLSQAQTPPPSISISLSPNNPAPGQNIEVSLESYTLNLTRSKISWAVDGQTQRTEIGLRRFFTTAGQAGVISTITAQIEAPTGEIYEKEISYIPAGVDLIYEVLSYTPPFYKGKALNSNESTVIVAAFPEVFDASGNKLKTQDLFYTWRKDGAVLADISGAGKNYFIYSGTVPVRDVDIEVNVTSADQTISASRSITIPRGNPEIIFYENSPIFGLMLNRAIRTSVKMLTDEFTVVGLPYHFSAGISTSANLDYVWSLNGQSVGNQDPKNSFTVRQETPGSGVATIGLKISNSARIFQFTNNSFIINFQKQ